jgi:hypothetical protein
MSMDSKLYTVGDVSEIGRSLVEQARVREELRDRFATAALQGLLAARVADEFGKSVLLWRERNELLWNVGSVPADLARLAYELAGAMLEARSR